MAWTAKKVPGKEYTQSSSVRFNLLTELDLIEYFENNGLKEGIVKLYSHYKATRDMKSYLDKELKAVLKSGIVSIDDTIPQVKEISQNASKLFDII
jgi:hypothetical protein